MKNLFKKIGALLVAAVMVLSMCTAVFADVDSGLITVNNLDAQTTIRYLQIITPDQTTETGWAFADGVLGEFQKVVAFKNLDEQKILWKLIKYANKNADVPEGIEAATVADFQAAMVNVEENLGTSYTNEDVSNNEITAKKAGVYAIKAEDSANYVYSPMAAFVSFETYTTEPTALRKDVTVNAKRTTIKIDKKSSETDDVVEINKEVEYTVTTNVPYIADDIVDDRVVYNITDEITGAQYKAKNSKLEVTVTVGEGDNAPTKTYTVEVVSTENGQKFVLNLKDIAKDRKNANKSLVIKYKAIVTSEKVENTVTPNDGKHTFTPETNTLYTGKITMTKTDDKEKPVALANAGFVIYREETTEVEGKEITKTYYAIVEEDATKEDNNEYVVKRWTESLEEAKADTNLIMTDSNGKAVVRGLDDSYIYNFKEIKAPEGYSVNTRDSVATWADAGNNTTAKDREGTASMSDTKLNSLPSTGGMGTYLFTIIGVVVMAGAAGAFFISRRKGSEE